MNMSRPAAPQFIENPLAPELFCEGPAGFCVLNGNVHITFTAQRQSHDPAHGPSQGFRVVVARLVLPLAGSQSLAAELQNFLKMRGLEPVPPGCGS